MKAEDLRPIRSREEALQIKLPPRPRLIRSPSSKAVSSTRYPLRGTPVYYEEPTEPIAESEWETLK
ncbi:MAG: hypothetical protein ABIP48_10485 [Planctomycetota bacterium]